MADAVPPRTLPDLLAARAALAAPALIDRDRPVAAADLLEATRRAAAGLAAAGIGPGDRVAIWLPNVPAWLATFFACAQLGAIAVAVNTRFRSGELSDILGRSRAKALLWWPGFDKVDFPAILAGCEPAALRALSLVIDYVEGGGTGTSTGGASAGGASAGGASSAGASATGASAADAPIADPPTIATNTTQPIPALPVSARRTTWDALCARSANTDGAAAPDAPCAIFTTSGTTKAPKFVLHDQRTLLGHAREVVQGFGLAQDRALLLAPPLCGVFGLCNAIAALVAGVPLVMMPVWEPAQAAASIERWQVGQFNGTDDAIAQLLATTDRTPAFPSVRFAGYAAFNPAQADIVARADARGLRVVGLYGISEIQALFARQDEARPLDERGEAGGLPVSPRARVRARDPQTGRIQPHGEPGELEFLAPGSLMLRYDGNDAATAEAIDAEGWYRSGDLGFTRPDGRFAYLTRMGDSIRLGGFLVSPPEIEACLQEVPGIEACQVVGVEHEGALRPVAFVRLAPGATLDAPAAIAHVAARLARYKVPIRVYPIAEFPVTEGTNATKIQKHRLRDLAATTLAAGG